MEKDRLFFDIVIFVAAGLVIIEAAPQFNDLFGGVITAITLIRILNYFDNKRKEKRLNSEQNVQGCDVTEVQQ